MHDDKDGPPISSATAETTPPCTAMAVGAGVDAVPVQTRLEDHKAVDGCGCGGDGAQTWPPASPDSGEARGQTQQKRQQLEEASGLGKAGLLGGDIIPLPSAVVAPHPRRHPQDPGPSPAPIKDPAPGPSRALPGGDQASQELPVHHSNDTMIFADLYKAPRSTFSKFRHSFPHGPPPPSDIDADLVSRDKTRNKEAIKRYLAEKVRNDWEFTWPPPDTAPASNGVTQNGTDEANVAEASAAPADPDAPRDPGEEADDESDAESVYSTISEDPAHFRPRLEWTSDLSDSDEPQQPLSPYRFDSPDAVGAAVNSAVEAKRARRRRAVREEAKWNPGLACFEARRDAWTGARTVRMKPKPPSPVSPTSPRRLSFWRHHRTQSTPAPIVAASGSPPAPGSPVQSSATRNSTTTASESDSGGVQRTASSDSTAPHILYPVHTVVPIPPPFLPPQNPIRASIQPSMYASLYDKVVLQNLQPSCPINLADMLRACVVGWKRDGEWPPRSTYAVPAPVQTYNAEVQAARQRKAQRQRAKDAAAAAAKAAGTSPPSATASRRLSLVGFFGGGGGGSSAANKTAAPAEEGKDSKENKENKDANKEGKENAPGHSASHSDEAPSGKALFRRSLQRVFSLGHGGHAHAATAAAAAAAANGNGNASPPPTSPTPTKEVAAAG
ncbi:hypothetical protein VTJ49DRAFT_6813 [Mycothermus thermophilus]|uniref:Gag1-like clamp domain-containing protein n=1 Tax=Humicola insolens TaxID=85995 RepID=A0ABR3V0S4_HUMIN